MAVENRLGGKVVLLLGNEASIDRFSENLAAEGASVSKCVIPTDDGATSSDNSAQYIHVVGGFHNAIERYHKVDVVLACLTNEGDGSYNQDQGVGNILEELKPIQNITYPATYIARVAHYILRTQGLERSEEGGAVPQVIYVVDIPNPIEHSTSPSGMAASNSVVGIVRSTAAGGAVHGYGVSIICARKSHGQNGPIIDTVIDTVIDLTSSSPTTFETNGKIFIQSPDGSMVTRSSDELGFRRAVGYKVLAGRILGIMTLTQGIQKYFRVMSKKEVQWGVIVTTGLMWAKGICPTILALWSGWLIGSGVLGLIV